MNYNDQPEREFKGVWIPKEIWLNPDFRRNRFERDILVEIHSLDNEFGCIASNSYFAEFFDCTPQNVSKAIKSLQDKGYLTITYKDERNFYGRAIRVNKAKFFGVVKPEVEVVKPEVEVVKPEVEVVKPEVEHNNIYNNKTNNTLSKGQQKFDEIKSHPVFRQQRQMKFPDLTDEQIVSTLDVALVDNARLSFASCINWLETENSKNKRQTVKQSKYQSKQVFKPYYRDYPTREEYEQAIQQARQNGLIVETEQLPINAAAFWGETTDKYKGVIKSVDQDIFIDENARKNELYNQINKMS